jgi:ABC-2 type transport system permease protein
MLAIFKREFKSYFQTLVGPIAIDIILVFGLLFFWIYNLMNGYSDLANTLYSMCMYGFTFAIPVLSMRCFADEKRNKSDQLLFTAPVSIGQIVIGKFLALAAVVAIPVALLCVLPPIMGIFGTVPYKWDYVMILGVLLYALMIIAISMFMSSLTESATIAAVFSILVTFLGMVLGSFYSNIGNEKVATVLSAVYDFGSRLITLLNGSFDITAVAYMLTVTALFLFLTTQSIQKRRYTVSKENASVGMYSAVMTVVMVVVVVFVNLAASQIPEKYRIIDVTNNGAYSLTDAAKEVASSTSDEISIYLMGTQEQYEAYTYTQTIVDNIKMFQRYSGKISYEFIDLETRPNFAQDYTTDTVSTYDAIVYDKSTNRTKVIALEDFLVLETDYQTYQQNITGYDVEGELAQAIQYVQLTEDKLVKAYTLTGHNETAFETSFTDVIAKANVSTEDLTLYTADAVPDDCSLLIINYPQTDLKADEVDKIKSYIDKGGNILAIFGYVGDADMTNFNTVLAYYGITNSAQLVYEEDAEHYYAYPLTNGGLANGQLLPVVNSSSEITKGVGSINAPILAVYATGLSYNADATDTTYTEILTTSDQASLLSFAADGSYQFSDKGTQVVGLEADKTLADGTTSTCIVYSSCNIFNETVDTWTGGANLALFSNTFTSMIALDSTFVSIPAEYMNTSISYSTKAMSTIKIVWWIIIIAILASGIVVFAKRRHM